MKSAVRMRTAIARIVGLGAVCLCLSASGIAGPPGGPQKAGPKQILVFTQYGDRGEEILRTIRAIETISTNYVRTDLNDFTQLDAAIVGKDVLLIPEQENADPTQLQAVGSAWASTLGTFVDGGGVVIQCDFWEKHHILDSAGLMTITGSAIVNDESLVVVDPSDPLAEGVSGYVAQNGSSGYDNADGNVVIQTALGRPVVIHKRLGAGSVVAIGHDYLETNADQTRVVANAVFNLPADDLRVEPAQTFESAGPVGGPFSPGAASYVLTNTGSTSLDWATTWSQAWLDVAPSTGTLGAGTSTTVGVTINANAAGLAMGSHEDVVEFVNAATGTAKPRDVSLVVGMKRILVYMQSVDASEEVRHTFDAIETVGTNYVRTNFYDYSELAALLPAKDVLLIPEQETANAAHLQMVGAAWAPILQPFVQAGGVVIQCDYDGKYQILDRAGLMTITGSVMADNQSMVVVDPYDPVGLGVSDYTGVSGCSAYNFADGNVVVQTAEGLPVVINKAIGLGNVVAIGHDYFETNSSQNRLVGNAVFRLPVEPDALRISPVEAFKPEGPPGGPFAPDRTTYTLTNTSSIAIDWSTSPTAGWLDVAPDSGTIAPGTSATVAVFVNAAANALARGVYTHSVKFVNVTSGTIQSRTVNLNIGRKRVLVYLEFSDRSEELPRTFDAIEKVSTNYIRTDLPDYNGLAAALAGQDVLLIAEQESASVGQLQTIGGAWAPILQPFVNNGGVVIQCDFNGKYHILHDAWLMSITGSTTVNGAPAIVADPDDPVADGVLGYVAQDGSSGYNNADGSVVIETAGGVPMIIHKRIGSGSVVAIGHDYYDSTDDQDRVVGNAVFNLPEIPDDLDVSPSGGLDARGPHGGPFQPDRATYTVMNTGSAALDWATTWTSGFVSVLPDSGTLAAGTSVSVQVSLTAAANNLTTGTHDDTVSFVNQNNGKTRRRRVSVEVDLRRVLAYVQYSPIGQEVPRTFAAIDTVGTNYIRTDLWDPGRLEDALAGKDVLLIPEQALADPSTLQSIGSAWGPTLQSFVRNGGVVVQCDFEGRYQILDSAGLLSITGSINVNDSPLIVADPTDPLAEGVSDYTAMNGSSGYTSDEGNVVVRTAGGLPVVIHRPMWRGSVVAIGHDYHETNPIQSRVVGNAVFNLPGRRDGMFVWPEKGPAFSGPGGGPFSPDFTSYTVVNLGASPLDWATSWTQPWLDVTPSSGTLAAEEEATVTVGLNSLADSLPYDTYTSDVVVFVNRVSSSTTQRAVNLTVLPQPPVIRVEVSAPLEATLPVDARTTFAPGLTIHNDGMDDLDFQISVHFSEAAAERDSMEKVRTARDSMISRSGVLDGPVTVLVKDPTDTSGRARTATYTRPEQIVSVRTAAGSGIETTGTRNVAICAADMATRMNDVQAKLLATGRFNSVTLADVAAVTPTLAELQAFDAVIVYVFQLYKDGSALGSVMADYVDSGGGVVCMMYEVNRSLFGLIGNFMTGRWGTDQYYTIPRDVHLQPSSRAVLGVVHDPGHPIMQGVMSIDGGPASIRTNTFDVMPGASRIADWSDGRPLVVTKTFNGVRRADLAFYPPSSDADSNFWQAWTDGDVLMANALDWVGLPQNTGWATVEDPLSASVPGGGFAERHVWFDSTGIAAGVHRATITIAHNDATAPPVDIPCTLTVVVARIRDITPNPAQPPDDIVVFEGASGDTGIPMVAFEWRSSIDGLLSTNDTFTSPVDEFSVGDHRITFTAWDNRGSTLSDTADLTILNALPVAAIESFWPAPVRIGSTVTVQLQGWDRDEGSRTIVEGELTWPDGVHGGILPGARKLTAPDSAGVYTVEYRVQDDEGAWSTPTSGTLDVVVQTRTRRWPLYR